MPTKTKTKAKPSLPKISPSKITPFLWFDNNAEEAAKYYVSIFKNSKINSVARNPEGAPGPVGAVLIVKFTLEGQQFIALNGGPVFSFNKSVSFFINCDTQKEIDMYWNKLSRGGEKDQCGWLTDKFGLAWQVVPQILPEMLNDKDRNKAARVMQAMMKMDKIDIAKIKKAYNQKA